MSDGQASDSFTTVAGPTTRRLRNGDTDNLYWVVGRVDTANDWRGPYPDFSTADAAAKALLNRAVDSANNFEIYTRVEVGKRYWLQNARKWLLRPESGYTQVNDLPADTDDTTEPPLATPGEAVFGYITSQFEYPTHTRLSVWPSALGSVWSIAGQLYGFQPGGGIGAITEEELPGLEVYWLPPTTSYAADPALDGIPVIVGPTRLQDCYISNPFVQRQGASPQLQIIVPRPVTDIPDDSGEDGYYLCGYQIGYADVKRFSRYITFEKLTDPPIITDFNYQITGDLSKNLAIPAGGASYFAFDAPETFLMAPVGIKPTNSAIASYSGPSAGTVVSGGSNALVTDAVIPPSPIAITPGFYTCDLSAWCVSKLLVSAVYVTRTDGVTVYTYSDTATYSVGFAPYPCEPPPTLSAYITGDTAGDLILPNTDAPGYNAWPTYDVYESGPQLVTIPAYSYQANGNTYTQAASYSYGFTGLYDVTPTPGAVPLVTWTDVPTFGGYTVIEEWGEGGSSPSNRPIPPASTQPVNLIDLLADIGSGFMFHTAPPTLADIQVGHYAYCEIPDTGSSYWAEKTVNSAGNTLLLHSWGMVYNVPYLIYAPGSPPNLIAFQNAVGGAVPYAIPGRTYFPPGTGDYGDAEYYVDQRSLCLVNGADCLVNVFQQFPAYGGGGSAPYSMPRADAQSISDYGVPCAAHFTNGIRSSGRVHGWRNTFTFDNGGNNTGDYSGAATNGPLIPTVQGPNLGSTYNFYQSAGLQYGPPPEETRYFYWQGKVGLAIVNDTQQPEPPYDNGSKAYQIILQDGRRAYYYWGSQSSTGPGPGADPDPQGQPGVIIIGWGGYSVGDGESGVVYTRPYYADGPTTYYINSDADVPVDPAGLNTWLPKSGQVLDPDTPVGSFAFIPNDVSGFNSDGTINPVTWNEIEAITIYEQPQKKSIE